MRSNILSILSLVTLIVLCSCISDKGGNRAIFYHDDAQTQKRAEGQLVNGQETEVWSFYSKEGQLTQKGNFENGSQVGVWKYDLPYVDSIITWNKISIGDIEVSIPTSFVSDSKRSEPPTVGFRDTLNNTDLGFTILEECDSTCINDFFKFKLNDFKEFGIEVVFAQSFLIKSGQDQYYYDQYNLKYYDRQDTFLQHWVYKKMSDNKVVFITSSNELVRFEQTLFLTGEIIHHLKYRSKRFAYPWDKVDVLRSETYPN